MYYEIIERTMLLVLVSLVSVSSCLAWVTPLCGSKSPENPSLILFLAGSATMGYHFLRARLQR